MLMCSPFLTCCVYVLHVMQAVRDSDTAVETPSTDAKDASLQQTADAQEAQQQLAELQEGQQQPPNKKVSMPFPAQSTVNGLLHYIRECAAVHARLLYNERVTLGHFQGITAVTCC